jgi:DNA processing protein
LIRSENVGPTTFRSLIQCYGSASNAIEAAPELSRRGGNRRPIRIIPEFEADDELSVLDERGVTVIALCEPEYPQALSTIHDPPPLLQVFGDVDLLNKPSLGIVGARNASAAGRVFAREISGALRHLLGTRTRDRYGSAWWRSRHRHDCRSRRRN